MSKYQITPSARFQRDLQRVRQKGRRLPDIAEVIDQLAEGKPLGVRYKDRPLGGGYAGYRECCVAPGCLMVYRHQDGKLILYQIRTPAIKGGYSMFLLTEIKYRLFRSPGRTALLLSIAALLVGSMAFYLGNIQANRAALDSLTENVPVIARVVNRNGTRRDELCIDTAHYDALAGAEVQDIQCTTTFACAYSQAARALAREGKFLGTDATLRGANSLAALDMKESDVEFLDGWGPGFFNGDEAVCLVWDRFAEEKGIRLGDEVSMPLFTVLRGATNTEYLSIGEMAMKVIGIYRPQGTARAGAVEFYAPVNWLRNETIGAGRNFHYESLNARLREPLELNAFKESLRTLGFLEVFETAQDVYSGDAVSMEDEIFIKTAGELTQNLEVFNGFLPPFFALVIGMVTLVTFLVLRSSRKEMAIASSLGRQKALNAASHFFGAFFAELAGCGVAFPLMGLIAGISLGTAWMAVGVYMVCACIGTALALVFLLRFDTLSMLTKVD